MRSDRILLILVDISGYVSFAACVDAKRHQVCESCRGSMCVERLISASRSALQTTGHVRRCKTVAKTSARACVTRLRNSRICTCRIRRVEDDPGFTDFVYSHSFFFFFVLYCGILCNFQNLISLNSRDYSYAVVAPKFLARAQKLQSRSFIREANYSNNIRNNIHSEHNFCI